MLFNLSTHSARNDVQFAFQPQKIEEERPGVEKSTLEKQNKMNKHFDAMSSLVTTIIDEKLYRGAFLSINYGRQLCADSASPPPAVCGWGRGRHAFIYAWSAGGGA